MTNEQRSSGSSIAALVCGIISIILCWVPIVGLVLGIIGCSMGGKGIREANDGIAIGKGMAIGGLVTGIIGTVIASFYSIIYIFAFAAWETIF